MKKTLRIQASELKHRDILNLDGDTLHVHGPTRDFAAGNYIMFRTGSGYGTVVSIPNSELVTVDRDVPAPTYKPGTVVFNGVLQTIMVRGDNRWVAVSGKHADTELEHTDADVARSIENGSYELRYNA
jgi:hypothetical protein